MSVCRYRAGKDVFLSYDREDTVKEFVRKLKRDLEGAQLSVWLDEEDIPAGTEKQVLAIEIALRDCKALVVVVTKKYISSSFCKSELYVACEKKKPVFPVIREEGWDVVFTKECSEGVKYVKATSNCVSFLPSDDYGAALQKLIGGLKESVARPLHRPIDDVKKQELNVRDVYNVLHEAGFSDYDWYQLGQQLIEMAALRRIKASDHEPSNCMIDTIAQWLQSDVEASWRKLAKAVTKVGGYGEATAKAVQQKAGIDYTSATPTLKELCNALDSVVNWYLLGVKLGMKPHELATIEKNYHGDNECCKLEMLKHSLRSGKLPTWKAVVDALHLMGEHRIALKIQAKYCSSSTDTDIGTLPATSLQSQFIVAIARRNIRKIKGKFSMLVTNSRKRLQHRINVKKFRIFLITMYSSPNSRDGSSTITTVIKSTESLDEMFVAFGEYGLWDYLNYDLLQEIIEEFASDDDELNDMMEQYQQDLTGYILTQKIVTYLEAIHESIFTSDSDTSGDELIPVLPPKHKHKLYKKLSFMCEVNVTNQTIGYVIDLWRSLQNQFELPPLEMILHDIAEGTTRSLVKFETSGPKKKIEISTKGSDSPASVAADREKELQQMQKEHSKQIKDLQHQLKVSDDQIREKDPVIAARQEEMQQIQQATHEKDHDIEIREQQLQQLNQQLTACQQVTAQLKETIQELQEEKEHLQQQLDKVLQQPVVTHEGYLRGVDVIAEASVLITNQAKTFHWAGYGLKLHVPQGALPAGLEECKFLIKVGISGHFALPQNTSLVSAVYWLDSEPRCKFLLPLTLEIQHCAMSSQTSRLSFALARCSQKNLPYTFDILEGGEFSSLSRYGCIQLQHFSLITLVKRKILGRDNVKYRARLYYIKREENLRDIHFVIIKDLKAHLTVVRQEYTSKSAIDTRVEFESETISLQLPSEEAILKGGWRILPLFPPVIIKDDVDSYKPGQGIPSCQLTAEWTNEGKPSRLIHKVTLEGAKEPFNYFRIVLDSISSAGLHSKYPAGLDSEPELSDLMNEIAAKIPAKWRDVGLQLGLDQGVLDGIALNSQGNTNHSYSNVFTKWKNLNSTTHPYTWSTILQALESRTVGEKLLASKIKNELTGHPPQ